MLLYICVSKDEDNKCIKLHNNGWSKKKRRSVWGREEGRKNEEEATKRPSETTPTKLDLFPIKSFRKTKAFLYTIPINDSLWTSKEKESIQTTFDSPRRELLRVTETSFPLFKTATRPTAFLR